MDFSKLIIMASLLGLFVFAMMSGSVMLTSQNNVNNTLMENDAINDSFGDIEAKLSSFQSNANGTKSSFEQETPTLGTDSFLFSSIINAGKTFTTMIVGVFNMTLGLISNTLGISSVVLGIFSAILLITIVLAAWKLYKTGK